jgi:hypothetical protein
VFGGAQDPDAAAAVPGHREDVHLRAIEQVCFLRSLRATPNRWKWSAGPHHLPVGQSR